MSAIGPKQTCSFAPHMSAFGGKADIVSAPAARQLQMVSDHLLPVGVDPGP
jgi:hypothetical protein